MMTITLLRISQSMSISTARRGTTTLLNSGKDMADMVMIGRVTYKKQQYNCVLCGKSWQYSTCSSKPNNYLKTRNI